MSGALVTLNSMTHTAPPSLRPLLHVAAPIGRLNDPNGLCIVGGVLHVFYQHDPHFPHAPKRTGWAHAAIRLDAECSAPQHYPDALYPGMEYDQHGCYSGCAMTDGEDVWLLYTGNVKKFHDRQPPRRYATQNAVRVHRLGAPDGGSFLRSPANPVIPAPPPGLTAHFRDPMVTLNPAPDPEPSCASRPQSHPVSRGEAPESLQEKPYRWRMVLGAQREDATPAVALYRGNAPEQWEYQGLIEFDCHMAAAGSSPDLVPGGYMWECPNLMRMRDEVTGEDLDVLLFCPQGLTEVQQRGVRHYASSDQCGYLVGRLEGNRMTVLRGFSELDAGHHFYAPQCAALATVPGSPGVWRSAIMLGWMGLPDADDAPTLEEEGWVHALTMPRTLVLRAGRLVQAWYHPMAEMEAAGAQEGTHATLVTLPPRVLGMGEAVVLRDTAGKSGPRCWFEVNERNRGDLGRGSRCPASLLACLDLGGDVRKVACSFPKVAVVVDGCALEVLINDGEASFSAMAYPEAGQTWNDWETCRKSP